MSWNAFAKKYAKLSSHLLHMIRALPQEPMLGKSIDTLVTEEHNPEQIAQYCYVPSVIAAKLNGRSADYHLLGRIQYIRAVSLESMIELNDAQKTFESSLEIRENPASKQFLKKIRKRKKSKQEQKYDWKSAAGMKRHLRELALYAPSVLHSIPTHPILLMSNNSNETPLDFIEIKPSQLLWAMLGVFKTTATLRDHPDNDHYLGKTEFLIAAEQARCSDLLNSAINHLTSGLNNRKTPYPKDHYWLGRAYVERSVRTHDIQHNEIGCFHLELAAKDPYFEDDAHKHIGYAHLDKSKFGPFLNADDVRKGMMLVEKNAEQSNDSYEWLGLARTVLDAARSAILPDDKIAFYKHAQSYFHNAIMAGENFDNVAEELNDVSDALRFHPD